MPPSSKQSDLSLLQLEFEILSTINEFFGTVRNVTLDTSYVAEFDLSDLPPILYAEDPNLSLLERIEKASKLLKKHRSDIEYLDSQIDPGKFRKVFERIGAPSTHSLELILQYYFGKAEKSKEDQDKVDLLATRWGSFSVSGPFTSVLRSSKDLALKLEAVYKEIGLYLEESAEEEAIVNKLQQFEEQINQISNFNEIVDKQIIHSLREYKSSLQESFYKPKILAKLIEINVAVHNLFQQLYDSEQARLHLYLEQAKKTAPQQEDSLELAQYQPILKMMHRANQMDRLLNDIKHAISTQQVIDQTFINEIEAAGRKMADLSNLLVATLQKSHRVGEALRQSMSEIQRLEKLSVVVSGSEKQVIEILAKKLNTSAETFLRTALDNAIISMAQRLKEGALPETIEQTENQLEEAISTIINNL